MASLPEERKLRFLRTFAFLSEAGRICPNKREEVVNVDERERDSTHNMDFELNPWTSSYVQFLRSVGGFI